MSSVTCHMSKPLQFWTMHYISNRTFWCFSCILPCNGTLEFPNCVNLVGADWMENLSWATTKPYFNFRETNTDPSMHFRKAITDPSMHFRKANTEFYSQFHFQLQCFIHSFLFCSNLNSLQFQSRY